MDERKPQEIEIADEERTQSIPFTDVFTRELTDTGSFDVRSEIWKTTFGKVIQALPIPALLVDGSFHVAVMNQAWMRITEHYGKSLSQPFTALFPDSSNAEKAQAILDEVFSTRKARVMECPLEIQGYTVWGRMTLRCVRVMEERLVLVLVEDLTLEKVLLRETKKHEQELEQRVRERTEELLKANEQLSLEVSQRKRAEEEAKASERRFKELAELLPQFVFEIDTSGRFTFVNRSGLEASGYTLEDFDNGLDASEMVAPQNRNVVAGGMERILRGEKLASFELNVQRKDGSTFPVVAFGTPIIRDDRIDGMRGVAIDITDRKKALEALEESEEKYRLVVENAGEAIIVAQDGKLKFVNPQAVELLGYSEAELKSRPFSEFIHPEDRELVVRRHEQRLKGASPPRVYPFRLVDKWENPKWVEISAVLITWEGRPATLNFLVDITARRRIEDELAKVEKLESLGLLAGGLAHDFNNYLTAILGNISLARIYSQSPEKAAKRLEEAERACSQAQGLTQQLLTFSKGGAPVRQVEDIGELVKNSCSFALRGSNATCDFLIPQDLWPVEVDKGQIGQVLNNLIINADQAMPAGGVIHVAADNLTVKHEDELPIHKGRYVKLMIKDQGVGIPEKILPRIFDPYFTTKHKGSGLGLATSYSIVKNHDGLITVESEVGTGTTFHVYLPASEKGSRSVPVSEGPVPTGAGRVLLMDDDESIRDLGREMLTSLGYDVELARNGTEAIEAYQTARDHSHPFDVVILDLTVPGDMGGSETIVQLRTIDPDVKAIVSSGYSNDPVLADHEEYGFRDVVSKPYTLRELGDALRRVLTQNT